MINHNKSRRIEYLIKNQDINNYVTRILDSKFEQVDVAKVAANQKHLKPNQHHDLSKTLAKYKKCFAGSHHVYLLYIDLFPGSEFYISVCILFNALTKHVQRRTA